MLPFHHDPHAFQDCSLARDNFLHVFCIFPRAYNYPVGPAVQSNKNHCDIDAPRASGRSSKRSTYPQGRS